MTLNNHIPIYIQNIQYLDFWLLIDRFSFDMAFICLVDKTDKHDENHISVASNCYT